MGWNYLSWACSPNNHKEEKEAIEKLCTFDGSDRSLQPIHTSKVGNTWYVAVKVTPKDSETFTPSGYVLDADGTYTFAAVFLTSRSDGGWGYKDMDETMGPREAKAPMTLVKKLSKLSDDDSYAHSWRKSCAQWAASKPPTLKHGDIIETRPIKLTSGAVLKKFRVEVIPHYSRKMKYYRSMENNALYGLKRSHLTGLTILNN